MKTVMIGRPRLACDTCAIRNRALCRGLSQDAIQELNRISFRRRFTPGATILHDAEASAWSGVILSGIVKLVKTTADGRQQIVALQFPGDYIGEPFGRPPRLSAEAVGKVDVCTFPKGPFEALLQQHPGLSKALIEDTIGALEAARDWMLVLGRKTAEERLATFLVLLAERTGASACPVHGDALRSAPCEPVVELPLSRSDMGKLLGLRIETVSRHMSTLKASGVISTIGTRGVRIHDLDRLRECAETDRE